MLILTKSIICLILGLIISVVLGMFIVPLFKRTNVSQNVSKHLNIRHLQKQGTPTMGGIIFVIPTLVIVSVLLMMGKLTLNSNFLILIIVFLSYALLGFFDDYLKISKKNNAGLSILTKFCVETIIAVIFFLLFMLNGNNTVLDFWNISLDLQYIYGFLILFLLIGCSNAVNITDGLDGLCAGISAIAFLTYGIIAWNSHYVIGYEQIAVFCFTISGTLIGFLFFNFYPAKIFMGDLGSLALGGALATIAILLKCEISLAFIGFVFIIETMTSFLQIISIKYFHKKLFLKSPLHHHLEELDFCEADIIKIFYTISLLCALLTLAYYVWL